MGKILWIRLGTVSKHENNTDTALVGKKNSHFVVYMV